MKELSKAKALKLLNEHFKLSGKYPIQDIIVEVEAENNEIVMYTFMECLKAAYGLRKMSNRELRQNNFLAILIGAISAIIFMIIMLTINAI